MKSKAEIKKLKEDWIKDPIWDIEDTEGFEDHREELKDFSNQMHIKWTFERQAKELGLIGIYKLILELQEENKKLKYEIERLKEDA